MVVGTRRQPEPGETWCARNWDDSAEALAHRLQPLQRVGSPADVAEAAVYLASDRAAQVSGHILPVDGGTNVGIPPDRLQHVMALRDSSEPS